MRGTGREREQAGKQSQEKGIIGKVQPTVDVVHMVQQEYPSNGVGVGLLSVRRLGVNKRISLGWCSSWPLSHAT